MGVPAQRGDGPGRDADRRSRRAKPSPQPLSQGAGRGAFGRVQGGISGKPPSVSPALTMSARDGQRGRQGQCGGEGWTAAGVPAFMPTGGGGRAWSRAPRRIPVHQAPLSIETRLRRKSAPYLGKSRYQIGRLVQVAQYGDQPAPHPRSHGALTGEAPCNTALALTPNPSPTAVREGLLVSLEEGILAYLPWSEGAGRGFYCRVQCLHRR